MKRDFARPYEGKKFFREVSTNKRAIKHQSHYGLSPVGQNRDADNLPYDEKGLGFDYEYTTDIYRGAIAIEKELKELELYGTINDLQSELVESARISQELVMADVFNRCLGTSGAPFVCEDGMYLIDSARPNAFKRAGSWSNLDSTGSITPSSLFQVQLNFAAHKDEVGQLAPLKLQRMIIRPQDEQTVWEILRSDLRPTDAMNAGNFQFGRFEYTVYNYLTSAVALYLAGDPKSSKNELRFVTRVAPSIETWKDGNNPDITRQRIRMAFGVGCASPRIWRGQAVS